MKIWLLSIAIMGIIIFFGISTEQYLAKSSHQLNKHLEVIELNINMNDWHQVNKQLSSFKYEWEQEKKIWYVLTNHREIDFIEESLSKLTKAVKYQGGLEAKIELGIIAHFLSHVPAREQLNSINIF